MKSDKGFVEEYYIQKISDFAFRNAAESWINIQTDMISWRKESGNSKYQKWAFSSLPKFEFMTLMLGSYFQSGPMDVKEITERLKVSEKTVYSFINVCEAEGWIDVSRTKKGNYYKASQAIVNSYFKFLTKYFDACRARNLKSNFDMLSALQNFRTEELHKN